MIHYAQLFADDLDAKGIKYTTQDDRIFKLIFSADNMDSITLHVYFEKEGRPLAEIKCWEIINFGDRQELAPELCNQMNNIFRFAKFHVNDKGDIYAEVDMFFTEETVGRFCSEMVGRMVCIVDDAYARLAKARWA